MEKSAPSRGFHAVVAVLQRRLGPKAIVKTLDARPTDGSYRIEIQVGRAKHRLLAHWAGTGWPEQTRDVLRRVRRPWPRNHLIVSQRFSEGTRASLRRLDANWVDQTGAARIATSSGLLILTEASQPAREQSRPSRRWTPASADVAEVLLAEGRVPRVHEITSLTDWRSQAVAKALRFLDAEGWTKKAGPARGVGAHRVLTEPDGLRQAWASFVATEPRSALLAHALMRDPLRYLERDLGPELKRLGRYAVSGWAGLQLIAPFMTSVPVIHVYVESSVFDTELRGLLRRLKVREVSEGERIVVWRARPAVFAGSQMASGSGGLSVAHSSRIYADLLTLGERGQEAADHLLLQFSLSQKQIARAKHDD